MKVIQDCGKHGYTVDNQGNNWYWKIENGKVSFRKNAGYGTNHPIQENNEIPSAVKQRTKEKLGLE